MLPQDDIPRLPEGALGRSGRAKSGSPESSPLFPGITVQQGSRSGSPAPPLEAVLLDRKRRGVSGSGGPPSGSGTPVRVASPNLNKGKFPFKSSPLGGLDRAGVVVAEVVKKGNDDEPERTFTPGPHSG